jgi:hypothetical protein
MSEDKITTWRDVEKRAERIHAEHEAQRIREAPAKEAEWRRARRRDTWAFTFKMIGFMVVVAIVVSALVKILHL